MEYPQINFLSGVRKYSLTNFESFIDTNQMIDKDKIILGRAIVEHSLSDKKMAFPCARISVLIMDVRRIIIYFEILYRLSLSGIKE